MSTYDQIATRERNYLLNTYARYPLVIARGKGVHVYDIEGRRYLDFVGGLGVNALGHAHPRIVKVIREQAAKVIHISNLYYNEYQGLLAEKLDGRGGRIEWGELALEEARGDRAIGMSFYARWSA